jgi:hypothetical protein
VVDLRFSLYSFGKQLPSGKMDEAFDVDSLMVVVDFSL